MEAYAGMDVHSKECVFEVQNSQGTIIARGSVATTEAGLGEFAALCPPGTAVALESGTVAFFVARQVMALGLVPTVIDAREVRLKAQRPRQKSDRRDAHELCEGLRRDLYRTRVHVPPAAIAELRETLSRRRHFVRLQCAEITAAKHSCAPRGSPGSRGISAATRAGGSCSSPSRPVRP